MCRPTDGTDECSLFNNMSALLAILIESDALRIVFQGSVNIVVSWLCVCVDEMLSVVVAVVVVHCGCLLYTSPSPRDRTRSRMPSSA